MTTTINKIKKGSLTFYTTCVPTDNNLDKYIEIIKKNKITHLVRSCELSYDEKKVAEHCSTYYIEIKDGKYPEHKKVIEWINYLYKVFYENPTLNNSIIIHCVAGLGRSPLLVVIGLIVCEKMRPEDALFYVRKHIKQCLNKIQVEYVLLSDWSKYIKHFNKLIGNDMCTIL